MATSDVFSGAWEEGLLHPHLTVSVCDGCIGGGDASLTFCKWYGVIGWVDDGGSVDGSELVGIDTVWKWGKNEMAVGDEFSGVAQERGLL